MPTVVTQAMARKAWIHGNKGKPYYDAMTDEQKRAMWQYGKDNGLIDTSELGPGASAEYKKYVISANMYGKSVNPVQNLNVIDPDKATKQGAYASYSGTDPVTGEVKTPKPTYTPQITPTKLSIKDKQLEDYDGLPTSKPTLPKAKKQPLKPIRDGSKLKSDKATEQQNFDVLKKELSGHQGKAASFVRGLVDPMSLGQYKASEQTKQLNELSAQNNILQKGTKNLTNPRNQQTGLSGSKVIQRKDGMLSPEEVGKMASTIVPYAGLEATAGQALTRLLPKLGGGIGKQVAKGAIAGSVQQGLSDIAQGKSVQETLKDVLLGAGLGALADIGLGAFSKGLQSRIAKEGMTDAVKADIVKEGKNHPVIKNMKSMTKTKEDAYLNDYLDTIGDAEQQWLNQANVNPITKKSTFKDADGNVVTVNKKVQPKLQPFQPPVIQGSGKNELIPQILRKKDMPHPVQAPVLNRTNVLDQTAVESQKLIKTDLNANNSSSPIAKEIEAEMDGATPTTNEYVKSVAPYIKDTKIGFSNNMRDVYRNFEDAFGKHYKDVKKAVLDPLDASKGKNIDEQKKYADDLYKNVVKGLDIKKGSKESAAVQWYGEGKRLDGMKEVTDPQTGRKVKVANETPYTLDDLKKDFPSKWQDIQKADEWFRKSYDELLDKVNASVRQIYGQNTTKIVPKRADYYRHFRELSDTFQGIRNLFDSPANIDPNLVGVSEWTQPKTRWASFKQQRGLGEYKADAVGGFLEYLPTASYAIHIDPHINVFRSMAKDIAEATEGSKNANNFIMFLRNYANDLAGKTNTLDRWMQDNTNRKVFQVLNAGNSRIKKNTVLANLSSAVAQLANVPTGVAKVKNPIALASGIKDTMAGTLGLGKAPEAYAKSQFIKERYKGSIYNKFDTKWIDQPEKFASWFLETADAMGTKFIWNSLHNQAMMRKIADPIKYADDVTRSLVAGRGIGEVPLMQKSKVFQLFAPFQLEVGNLWSVMKDMVNEKDFAGLAALFVGNYIYNNFSEEITGKRVTFDPINAIAEALKEENTTSLQKAGRLVGEVASNVPLGNALGGLIPEEYRKKYLGRNDPTRFGGGLLLSKGFEDPFYKLVMPFGGNQVKKTIEGLQSVQVLPKNLKGEKQALSGSYSSNKLRFPIEKSPENMLKSGLFGQYSSNEAVNYFKNNDRILSEKQTKQLEGSVKRGNDPKEEYKKILIQRKLDELKKELSVLEKDGTLTLTEKSQKRLEIYQKMKDLK